MRIFLSLFLIVHALIHLLGCAKAFIPAKIPQLAEAISRPTGILWLLASIGLMLTALLFVFRTEWWWVVGIPAVMLSQTLIFMFWSDAKFGTVANIILLLPLIVAIADALPESYRNIYRTEAKSGLSRYSAPPIITEADIVHLPPPVQRYLRYVGVLEHPRIENFSARFTGQFKRTPESGWMDFSSQQYNFFDDPTRIFFIHSPVFGIPIDGLHLYKGGSATMRIKVGSLFQVVDAKGDTMTKGETVTLFNDMCIMAPATLIDSCISWEPIDSLTTKATFTNKGFTISATLVFNDRGELVDFRSDDRFMSGDGITYKNYRWTTPMKNYRDFDGRKIAGEAELIWHMPQSDYIYGRFHLEDIEYNCSSFLDINSETPG